jgi:hypothetical protein
MAVQIRERYCLSTSLITRGDIFEFRFGLAVGEASEDGKKLGTTGDGVPLDTKNGGGVCPGGAGDCDEWYEWDPPEHSYQIDEVKAGFDAHNRGVAIPAKGAAKTHLKSLGSTIVFPHTTSAMNTYPRICQEVGLDCETCTEGTARHLAKVCKGLHGKMIGQMFVQIYSDPACSKMHGHFAEAYLGATVEGALAVARKLPHFERKSATGVELAGAMVAVA